MGKYRYQDDTNIDRLQLCYEENCTFVGGPKDFHDVYSDGRFSCPFHLEEHMVLGSEVEDIHIKPISCLCEARIRSNPEFWICWRARERERDKYEKNREQTIPKKLASFFVGGLGVGLGLGW